LDSGTDYENYFVPGGPIKGGLFGFFFISCLVFLKGGFIISLLLDTGLGLGILNLAYPDPYPSLYPGRCVSNMDYINNTWSGLIFGTFVLFCQRRWQKGGFILMVRIAGRFFLFLGWFF
jgi:hypothetical protein